MQRQAQILGRFLLFTLVCLSGAGCGDGDDAAPQDQRPALEGGSFDVPGCGYAVTTRLGASVPKAAVAKLGTAPTPKLIHLGLSGPAATSMAVVWRTEDETTTATTVQYGVGDALDQSADGFTFVHVAGLDLERDPLVQIHETHLCGLAPDTEYSYRVGGKDDAGHESWSSVAKFRTAPDVGAQPDAEVVALVLGDSRGGYDTWGELLTAADTREPFDVILFSGDAVVVGQLQEEWDEWLGKGEAVLRKVPLLAAHGNHEANAVNFFSALALPGDEENYGLDYGPFHLTVLNDTPDDSDDVAGANATFLEQDLTASTSAPWKLVMHHKSMWSAAANHGSNLDVREAWGPIVDAHTVDLVVSGHDHNYERTKPLRAGALAAGGTTYLVAGSAGADLYASGMDFWTEKSESTHNYVALRLRAGSLDLRAYRPDGTMIDSLTLTK